MPPGESQETKPRWVAQLKLCNWGHAGDHSRASWATLEDDINRYLLASCKTHLRNLGELLIATASKSSRGEAVTSVSQN